jgi:phosphoglycolate phosphatase-like HAD superfamily hydrolase
MFAEMRTVLGIPKSVDILNHIYSLPPANQPEAMAAIRTIESTAMRAQVPQPGLASLMAYLDSRSIPKSICTRNFDGPVAHLLGKFLAGSVFHPIVTRDFRPPKPDPAGILHIAKTWGLVQRDGEGDEGVADESEFQGKGVVADASGLIMVGDSMDDMMAGRRAGAATVLLANDVNGDVAEHDNTDLVISRLDELIEILENGFEGRKMGG